MVVTTLDMVEMRNRVELNNGLNKEDANRVMDEVMRWRWEAVELLKELKAVKIKGDKGRTEKLLAFTRRLIEHMIEFKPLTKAGDEYGVKLANDVSRALAAYGISFPAMEEIETDYQPQD